MMRWAGSLAAASLLTGVAVAQSPAPASDSALKDAYRYVIRPGDNLYTLGSNYLVRGRDVRMIRRLNHVRDPRRLRVGAVLAIPRALLRSVPLTARIVAFRGAVMVNGRAAGGKIPVSEGALVETAAQSFVSLALADGSTVTLPSASSIRVVRLRRLLISGEVDRAFRLEAGRSQLKVTPRERAGDRFEVSTRLSVAAVRGTEFRVALLPTGQAATAEVLEGVVSVSANDGSGAPVTAGTGSRTTEAGTTPPVPLLAAPAIREPGKSQSDAAVSFVLEPLPGAERYRLQIGSDAGFLDILAELEMSGTVGTFASLPNGDYFVRATAIDSNGLEGLARVYSFERALNGVRASASQGRGRRLLFRWTDLGDGPHSYRFVLARADAPGRPLIDEAGLTRQTFAVTALPPGEYVWKVQTSGVVNGRIRDDWAAAQTLTVAGGR